MQKWLSLFIFSVQFSFGIAQNNYPTDYFISPIHSPLSLVGNFGEIRPNHFHAGFDIKTNGKEGMPVYAVADGYVSRIKISAFGYGKALYITHPNGYTSVYGHLQKFDSVIANYAKKIQYAKESFEIDTLLSPGILSVKKNELIALSGNTGGSEGPHLHFEMRETKTEMPVNPYFFGFQIKDNVRPHISEIAIYPIDENSTVNGKHFTKKIKPVLSNGKQFLSKSDTITVCGTIGFGIECSDTETGSTNKNGVFSIELQSNGKRIYYDELEKFSFDNSRFVNAHIDFAEKQKHKDNIQKCFLSKNNKLGIYKNVVNDGIVNFSNDSMHWIKYIVKDFSGNVTELLFKVKSKSANKISEKIGNANSCTFDCLKENQYKTEDIQISIPAYDLYDDLKFNFYKSPAIKGTYSFLNHIQNNEIALQKTYSLSIKAVNLPTSLQNKAAIISINSKGKQNYESGMYKDGWVTTQTKIFGNFAIIIDTIPPILKLNFKLINKNIVDFSKAKTIEIKATDNLSGIKKYRASVDNKWVLCEYDFKKDLLFYTFDKTLSPGKHSFNIEVSDDKNNTASLSCTFMR